MSVVKTVRRNDAEVVLPVQVLEIHELRKDRGEIRRADKILSKHGLKSNTDLNVVANQINDRIREKTIDYVSLFSPREIVDQLDMLARLVK